MLFRTGLYSCLCVERMQSLITIPAPNRMIENNIGKRNVLWIMADQLRFDYLSCYGHPSLHTPNLDALAAKGVRFDRAYVQSPFCGPSRASYYTGRYCRSHGATWNGFPLRVGEPTLGDHMREIGVRCALVGKTHMMPDLEGMKRLGIDPDSVAGQRHAECGFEPYERDDGLHPYGFDEARPSYDDYLRRNGFDSTNPWEEWANSGIDKYGNVRSGWFLKYSDLAARVPAEHSETAYITGRAIDFMQAAESSRPNHPWLMHLSYIKPHWPYIVSPPYHEMYGPEDVLPAVRSNAERQTDHPLFRAYQNSRICQALASEEARQKVIPAYMGLVKQLDDQLGRLLAWMEDQGLMDNTMIVFSSDHGDYLGDHWMGEKDLFHEPSLRTPLIVYDPRSAADITRGQNSDELVEAIDLLPTFQSFFGGPAKPQLFEGLALDPLLHDMADGWRDVAFAEYDIATRPARLELGTPLDKSGMVTVVDKRWKYTWFRDFRPVLFDLEKDPRELIDLGADPDHEEVRQHFDATILEWATRPHGRTTMTHEQLNGMAGKEPTGILIGLWDEDDYERVFGRSYDRRPGLPRRAEV